MNRVRVAEDRDIHYIGTNLDKETCVNASGFKHRQQKEVNR